MSNDTFLLSHTPTTEHRVTMKDNSVILSQTVTFDLSSDRDSLKFFLQAVKEDKKVRHTYTVAEFIFEYDPSGHELERFWIMRRATGRCIVMGYSTAYRLLLALTGKTERLIREEPTP